MPCSRPRPPKDIISIHAPAGGATTREVVLAGDRLISIHAPAGGATRQRKTCSPIRIFQFTPLREGRHRRGKRPVVVLSISIHAPAGGATRKIAFSRTRTLFQFTPLREGRLSPPYSSAQTVTFQFTPLREGRRDRGQNPPPLAHFNSRPCGRGDQANENILQGY